MPISIQQWGVAYVMAYGLVLTFMDWHKEGGELIVKGKVRKFLQDNWIWKTSCNIFSSLYCQIAKGPMQRGWRWNWISTFFDLWVCVTFLPISTRNWQVTLKFVLQMIHNLQHIFYLKDFWKFSSHDYWKMLLEVPSPWHQVLGPPLSPLRADFGVYERLLILSPLVASAKQSCFIRLLRLLIMKRWLCSLLSV